MNTLSLALLVLALPPSRPGVAPSGDHPVLEHCRVALIEEAQVPGREAGALTEINVKEGMQIKKGEELGRIDDLKASALKRVKEKEYESAREQAADDVNVRFSKAAAGVAKLEWQKVQEANKRSPGSVAEIEIKKLELAWKKADLQIEKSQLEMKVAKLTSEVKSAEVDATEAELQLRRIVSPLDGIVVHVYKHLGEWIPPGDPVVQIVRVDRLRVEGFVNAAEYGPEEVSNRNVIVETELARGRKMQFKGKIVFVSPLVQPGGEYLVWAEVENKQEAGQWLLRPGVTATMTIQMK